MEPTANTLPLLCIPFQRPLLRLPHPDPPTPFVVLPVWLIEFVLTPRGDQIVTWQLPELALPGPPD